MATSGSAVVFAGLTVIIALVGLAIANIPFLTTMGAFGAVAVAIGVLVALTLLPAILGFLGERARPRKKIIPPKERAPRTGGGASGWWVRVVTKWPVVTILVVVAGLGALRTPPRTCGCPCPTPASCRPAPRRARRTTPWPMPSVPEPTARSS